MTVAEADLEGGDDRQLVAAQQLLECHADSLLGCIHVQYTSSHLLSHLVLAAAALAYCVCCVQSWHHRPDARHKHFRRQVCLITLKASWLTTVQAFKQAAALYKLIKSEIACH